MNFRSLSLPAGVLPRLVSAHGQIDIGISPSGDPGSLQSKESHHPDRVNGSHVQMPPSCPITFSPDPPGSSLKNGPEWSTKDPFFNWSQVARGKVSRCHPRLGLIRASSSAHTILIRRLLMKPIGLSKKNQFHFYKKAVNVFVLTEFESMMVNAPMSFRLMCR